MIDACTDDPFEDPHPVKYVTFMVWMHKPTGKLCEKWMSWFGEIIAWEDLSLKGDVPCSQCNLEFHDQFNKDDFEELGPL